MAAVLPPACLQLPACCTAARKRISSLSGHAPHRHLLGRLPTNTRSSNRLRGTLPPALGAAWLNLEKLSLQGNALSGTLPPAYAAWVRLKELSLGWVGVGWRSGGSPP